MLLSIAALWLLCLAFSLHADAAYRASRDGERRLNLLYSLGDIALIVLILASLAP